MSELMSILKALEASAGTPAALATLVSVEGSSYRRPGARALFLPGRKIGSISGGCLEEDVRLRAEKVLQTSRSELIAYDTTQENDLIWGLNVGCRGVVGVFIERLAATRPHWVRALAIDIDLGRPVHLGVVYGGAPPGVFGTYLAAEIPALASGTRVFVERIAPPPALTIFGAGDDAIPLARMAKLLDWKVTVVDARADLAKRDRFPEADAIIVTPAGSMDEHVEIGDSSYAVVMTHRFDEDLALLRILLGRPLSYLGLLGSRGRAERLLARLHQEGAYLDPAALQRLCAPVGLDLGATTPEAIALSILSEMQCRHTGRVPLPLRDRAGTIHG